MKGSEIFGELANKGKFLLNSIREKGWTPNIKKNLRTFGASEAARMIGKNRETIRNHEKAGTLPSPKDKNGQKYYTLEDINLMRNFFGTSPQRNNKRAAIIAVINGKGGVQKTTTSINLAQGAALKGHRVLLADGDHQGSATMLKGFAPREDISPNDTLLSYFRKPITGIEMGTDHYYVKSLKPLIKNTYFPCVDIIPANLSLYNVFLETTAMFVKAAMAGVKYEYYNLMNNGFLGTSEIKGVADDYDLIIIDCPPYIDTLTFNALYAADAIIVTTPPIMTDLSSTIEFFEMLHDIFSEFPDREFAFIKMLLTKLKPGSSSDESNHNAQIAKLVKHFFGDKVLVNSMVASDAVEKTSTQLKTIYDMTPSEFASTLNADRKTLKRAILSADNVNAEILQLVNSFRDSLPDLSESKTNKEQVL